MQFTSWRSCNGHTLVVLFENGSAAESETVFENPNEMRKARHGLERYCGETYGRNNLPWTMFDPKTGEKTVKFIHRQLNIANSPL